MKEFNNIDTSVPARIITAWQTPGQMTFDSEESRMAGPNWNVYIFIADKESYFAAQCGDGFTYFSMEDENGITNFDAQKI